MPLVRVRYQPMSIHLLPALKARLPVSVSDELECEGGELTPEDIEVHFDECSQFDVMPFDFTVDIEAMEFPDRAATFDDRIMRIGNTLADMLGPLIKFGVWGKLCKAAWDERR